MKKFLCYFGFHQWFYSNTIHDVINKHCFFCGKYYHAHRFQGWKPGFKFQMDFKNTEQENKILKKAGFKNPQYIDPEYEISKRAKKK